MRSRLAIMLIAILALVLACGRTDPATGHDAPNDKIAVIGDSLTYQEGAGRASITDRIRQAGHGGGGIYFWGVNGKQLIWDDSKGTTTLENINAARARLGHVDTWVIALGTNDRYRTNAVFRAYVDRILTALGDDDIVWIGLGFRDDDNPYADRLNPILWNAIAGTPNGVYADWDTYIHKPVFAQMTGLWATYDNIHMTQKGYAVRAAFYAQSIT